MQSYPSYLLENAVNQLSKLPGVGKKSALRLALHLLKQDEQQVNDFAQSILLMKNEIKYCKVCRNISDSDVCQICSDPKRDATIVCVVETIKEVMLVEETQQYKGLYHVLGGVISPMDGVKPSDLEIQSLVERVASGEIKEVIMALSPTMEGDTTSYYIARKLKDLNVKITAIARGISVGDELQYSDSLTLGRSIIDRIEYKL
ncbi:MAG: recombination protein RecR [Paludibacteraceae bacterium]|nr:recombination protein RecR [Paludibacteraceae bacterium]MBQ2065499.1 recombination protein RecR [Paludibacteraceae bacterium]